MDVQTALLAVKAVMALDRKIDFVRKMPGLDEARREELLLALQGERLQLIHPDSDKRQGVLGLAGEIAKAVEEGPYRPAGRAVEAGPKPSPGKRIP